MWGTANRHGLNSRKKCVALIIEFLKDRKTGIGIKEKKRGGEISGIRR